MLWNWVGSPMFPAWFWETLWVVWNWDGSLMFPAWFWQIVWVLWNWLVLQCSQLDSGILCESSETGLVLWCSKLDSGRLATHRLNYAKLRCHWDCGTWSFPHRVSISTICLSLCTNKSPQPSNWPQCTTLCNNTQSSHRILVSSTQAW